MRLLLLLILLLSTDIFAKDFTFAGQEFPPYNYLEGNRPAGAMVDFIAAICAITKDHCIVEIVPIQRLLMNLKSGELQGAISMVKNADRDSFATFLRPLIQSDMILASTYDKKLINSVQELKGWSIGAVAGSNSAQRAALLVKEAGGGARLIEDNSSDILVMKASNGRYGDKGAIIINENILAYLAKKNSIKNLKQLYVAYSDQWGIYLSNKSATKADIDRFNSAIEKIKKNGELEKIIKKHHLKDLQI